METKYNKKTIPLNICFDDIYCKNKKCSKEHVERKRLNICRFDIFFIPYKDDGCHFEDCEYIHPKRRAFYTEKNKDFDNLVLSVFNHLELDDDTSIIDDWKKLMININGNDFDITYQEIYTYCLTINHLSYELEGLQFFDIKDYINNIKHILSNIYMNYEKIKKKINYIVLMYEEHIDQYRLLISNLDKDIEYVNTYQKNAKIFLYQNYGINIHF